MYPLKEISQFINVRNTNSHPFQSHFSFSTSTLSSREVLESSQINFLINKKKKARH